MARPINRLSARQVATIKAAGSHADGGGLYLVVDKSGAKRWSFVFFWRKARKEMGLGGVGAVTLQRARDLAAAARAQVAAGVNPIEARRATRIDDRFVAIAESVLEERRPGWSNAKHVYQWERSLRVFAKPLHDKACRDVTTEDVLGALKPIWARVPETAQRTRERIEAVLDAAKARGLIPDPWSNPARWRGHLAHLLAAKPRGSVRHQPAMPFSEAPSFLGQLRQHELITAAALEFTILCAARTGETTGARWREVDMATKIWTVPAERMKRRLEHQVPLSAAAIAVLDRVRPPADQFDPAALIFPGFRPGRPLSNMAMEMLLRRMLGQDKLGPDGKTRATVHGFRSTFSDWAGETTNFPREIVEMALSHAVGDEVERAYRRATAIERRRRLMEAWAGYLGRRHSSTKPAGQLIELKRA